MARSTNLKFISILLFILPLGSVFAETEQCPYRTTSECVDWMQLGIGRRAWTDENNKYWKFQGHLKPSMQLVELEMKLLGSQDSWMNWNSGSDDALHVIDDKGRESFYPTHLVEAYKQKDYSYVYGVLPAEREIDRITFDVYVGTISYRVILVSKTHANPVTSVWGWHEAFITYVDREGSVRRNY